MEISTLTSDSALQRWEKPKEDPAKTTTWKRRTVEWLLDPNTPLLYKVAAAALVTLGLIGFSVLTNPPIAGLAALAIVLLFSWERRAIRREEGMQTKDVEEVTNKFLAQQAAFNKMKNAVGGPDKWEKIPVLPIGKEVGQSPYLDFMFPRMLRYPVMRGSTRDGRPFLALKLHENGGEAFVATFHQRYDMGGSWVNGLHREGNLNRYMNGPDVNNKVRRLIREVVVTQKHPTLKLGRRLY